MSWIKVILINILITFSLLGMLLVSPPILNSIYSSIVSNVHDTNFTDERSELALYIDAFF